MSESSLAGDHEPSYYDIPMLKRPLWRWEIAWYFFLGGVSSGAYILARLAERHGARYAGRHDSHDDVTRIGTYLALASFLPCPPLLIHDLGDPKRFHHMLRVFKPGTPMNFGTWSIVGYSGMAAAAALREYMKDNVWGDRDPPTRLLRMADKALLVLHDAAGIPFAILVAGYTGVLLSCTANPLWAKNPWLGPLFSASAIATGAEAIGLVLDCTSRGSSYDGLNSHWALRRIDTIAHAVEGVCMRGFTRYAGEAAKPLHTGAMAKHHKLSIGAIIAAEAIKLLPAYGRGGRLVRTLSNALGLAGGFALRWAIVHGGREAADDPHLARVVSDPEYRRRRDGGMLDGRGWGRKPIGREPIRQRAIGEPTSGTSRPQQAAAPDAGGPRQEYQTYGQSTLGQSTYGQSTFGASGQRARRRDESGAPRADSFTNRGAHGRRNSSTR